MENVVPSTSLTNAVSLLGPDNSTAMIDLAESFNMISNSAEVTLGMLGMGSALATLLTKGAVVIVVVAVAAVVRRIQPVVVVRRDRIERLSETLFVACNANEDDGTDRCGKDD